MNRRTYLGGIAAGLTGLAGCAGVDRPQNDGGGGGGSGAGGGPSVRLTVDLTMEPVSDLDIARRVLKKASEQTDRTHQMIKEGVENGSATVKALEPPASTRGAAWVYEDTVYRLSYEVIGEQPAYHYSIGFNPVEGTVSADEEIPVEELPAVDREKLAEQAMRDVGADTILGVVLIGFIYTKAEHEDSALVPTPRHSVLRWESGRRGRVTVEGVRETSLKTYHYTVEKVGTPEAYGQDVREQYAFELSDLSTAQRAIVEQAISADVGYLVAPVAEEPEATPSPALRSLVDRFSSSEPVLYIEGDETSPALSRMDYLVRYEGQTYWTTLVVDGDEFPSEPEAPP